MKTSTAYGSGEKFRVHLFTIEDEKVGGFNIHFNSDPKPKYLLTYCTGSTTDLKSPITPDTGNIWKVTLIRTSEVRLMLHINSVKLFDEVISELTCAEKSKITNWSNHVTKIQFLPTDTVSDFYKRGLPLQL